MLKADIVTMHLFFFSFCDGIFISLVILYFGQNLFLVQSQKFNRAVLQCKTETHFSNQTSAQVISFSLSLHCLFLPVSLFFLTLAWRSLLKSLARVCDHDVDFVML